MIQIPTQKPSVCKNNNAEAIASGSEQITGNVSVSVTHHVPSTALGTESPENAVSTMLPPQTLVQHLQDSASGIDIQWELTGKYNNNLVFSWILENPKHLKNFEVSDEILLSPPQIPAGLKGFLGIPQDYTIISVILSWKRKILSSPQESSGLGQSLAEFLLN